jgi:hypothetical protein
MDPGFYRSMTDVMGRVLPRPSDEALTQVGDPSVRKNGPENSGWKPAEDMIPDLGGQSMPITVSPNGSSWWGDMVVDEA